MSSDDATISLFVSSISSKIYNEQRKVEQILTAKKIQFKSFDVASSEDIKTRMRDIMGDEKGLPPQVSNGDVYCGTFAELVEANETDQLYEFLKLPPLQQPQVQS